ncbi:hypothetical protein, partial [Methanobrevibacter sp.]
KEYDCIPKEEKRIIIPAMYLNIQRYIDDEYEQEKLLEAVNMLKYCENELDRKIRLAREDESEKVTERVTKSLTEEFASKLLRADEDVTFVHEITDLPISRIKELKANL